MRQICTTSRGDEFEESRLLCRAAEYRRAWVPNNSLDMPSIQKHVEACESAEIAMLDRLMRTPAPLKRDVQEKERLFKRNERRGIAKPFLEDWKAAIEQDRARLA